MAITGILQFKAGTYANLPATKAAGALYFVTDKNLIIAGDGSATGIRFGGDIQMVANIAALTADTQPKSGVLYYAIAENVLAYYNSTSSKWIQLNAAGLTGVTVSGTGNVITGLSVATDSTTGALKLSATKGTMVASVTQGSANGTIAVDGTDVSVKGLGTAAYTASTAYDAAGAASTAVSNFKTNVTGTPDTGKTLQDEIDALETLVGSTGVATQISNVIGGLDATKSQTGASGNGWLNLSIVETDGKITGLTGSITASKYADYAYEAKVTTLIGSDTNKSVRTIANEELAASLIPSGAAESLDTLQEIAAWIQAHPGDAATMNSKITTLEGASHSHTNATVLNGITSTKVSNWDTAATNSHTHSNASVLNGISSTNVTDWNDAVSKEHTHSNATVLDGITSAKVSNWDAAYGAITWGTF